MAISANVVDGILDKQYTTQKKDDGVSNDLGYDQFLQLLCAEMEYQDPLEPTSNTDYIAQLATFSQLESTLSLEDTTKNNFATSLVGKEVSLAITSATGNKEYVDGRVDFVTYQEGESFLSINGSLYKAEYLESVVSDDFYEADTLASNFSTMVGALPNMSNLTYQYEGAVNQLRTIYDSMTDYQKKFIDADDYKTFTEVETRVKELVKEHELASS